MLRAYHLRYAERAARRPWIYETPHDPPFRPMTSESTIQQQPAALSASKLPLLLRAVADPEGKGLFSAEDAALVKQVETNLARPRGETDQSARTAPEPT